jgi:hypothetical protein
LTILDGGNDRTPNVFGLMGAPAGVMRDPSLIKSLQLRGASLDTLMPTFTITALLVDTPPAMSTPGAAHRV